MFLILFIVISVISLKLYINRRFLINTFKDNNVIVFGKKGTGKDLLFQMVINGRNDLHYSNNVYHKKTVDINIGDITVAPNTWENIINGEYIKISPIFEEKKDFYISDAGIYLPSQYDNLLNKKYPSLPIMYAIVRHLYNSNIHINTQALNRIWLKLREQADHYVKCVKSFKFLGLMFSKVIYYSDYESANKNVLPMDSRILNKYNKALIEQHEALYGVIKSMWYCQRIKKLTYDSRHFKNKFFEN